MARDYKRSRRTSKRSSAPSPWTFLASGFGLGIIAALGLYLYLKPSEVVAPDRPVPNTAAAPQSSIDANNNDEPTTQVATTPTAPTKAPASPPAARVDSDYEFYDVLPNFEVVVSDENNQPVTSRPSTTTPTRSTQTPATPSTYILQAGSFKKHEDADRRKAELAFKGIESKIQRVVLNEGETWYRVYVGPGTDIAAFENMRSDLRRANIDVLLLKVRQ